ncbi:hypothetical protein LTR53_010819 [Teratosphaeriaceae sp. CCFEE 6253]|nr:hypothetical protein LTR53_010819 [Teratosphaeriaceae sp. CCFEE 6253]
MPSPKRKSADADFINTTEVTKKLKADGHDIAPASEESPGDAAPDALINHQAAIAYWSATEPTVNGVLGGFPQVSRVDLQGSSNFLAKLRRASKHHPPGKKLRRAADCGAGIGRITEGFLTRVVDAVDIVEPVKSFTDQIEGKAGVGAIYNVGLESWHPDREGLGPYDLIWNQWCVGQLTDAQLVEYLQRLPRVLSEGGWIVVKENLSNHHRGEDVYDDEDNSVTRSDSKFRRLFQEAGLKLVSTELQRGMPEGLYPVRAYALQPR